MNKWTNAARKRREWMDAVEIRAADLEILVSEMKKLPPGQLKKVLTEEVLAVLEKYGVALE